MDACRNNCESQIADFYNGRSIFVTGATGFVGKALVEKLVRSCPGVQNVFCLVRPKNGKDVDSRFRDYTKNSVFNRVRKEDSRALEKLRLVAGDVLLPNLGLSEADFEILRQEVSVVFHTAATIRFNESIGLAVEMNTLGTRRIIDLCKQLPCLKAFVHTSTAYSNADKREVLEKVYDPIVDPDTLINFVKNMPEDILNGIEPVLIGGHPNTYTFTKALAEVIVEREASTLPTAIVRPSIVTAAVKEPQVGWIDNTSGITGIVMEVSRGTIRSVLCDKNMTVDIIPVDIVVNTLLVAAANLFWHRPEKIQVYNCTTGTLNPLQWEELRRYIVKAGREVPSRYVQWYPGCTFRINFLMHRLTQIFLHFLPAYFLDLIMKFQGLKPMMVKICQKTMKSAKAGEFFSTHQWNFGATLMENLDLNLNKTDRELFPVNVKTIGWEEYIKIYVTGIRKFILKDELSSLTMAQKKLKKLYWGQRIVQCLAIFMFVAFILK
ncbi:putative fatty acyl-CoA reductase CG5065 [Neocloeon triangulifer]|uniref:putative fatty acyl-CoA reductase CG5065 n=1 Tax=Neocloeon triangulifer TaxID=2078957 RepID=UPI00286FA0CE|nr:putative fatty acyl-CoA reductase CG5065 [Neocloeon triangulifer]